MHCSSGLHIETTCWIFHYERTRGWLVCRRSSQLAGKYELLLIPTGERSCCLGATCRSHVELFRKPCCGIAQGCPRHEAAALVRAPEGDVFDKRPVKQESVAVAVFWHEADDRRKHESTGRNRHAASQCAKKFAS